MDSVFTAMEAKNKLNNTILFDDGSRLNIFFSTLKNIRFHNSNTGGIDYTLINSRNQSPNQYNSNRTID